MKKTIAITICLLLVGTIAAQAQNLELVRYYDSGLKKFGIKDQQGKIVIEAQYEDIGQDLTQTGYPVFTDGLATVKLEGKWGVIDLTGKMIIPPQYKSPIRFREELANATTVDGAAGFIDKTGQTVIPFIYTYTMPFVEGLAWVKIGGENQLSEDEGRWGYIDRHNKMVIPPVYEYAKQFSMGLAPVKFNGKWGYISKMGDEVSPFQYSQAEIFSARTKRAMAKMNGKDGYVTHPWDGKELDVSMCKMDFPEYGFTINMPCGTSLVESTNGQAVLSFAKEMNGQVAFEANFNFFSKRNPAEEAAVENVKNEIARHIVNGRNATNVQVVKHQDGTSYPHIQVSSTYEIAANTALYRKDLIYLSESGTGVLTIFYAAVASPAALSVTSYNGFSVGQ